MPDIETEVLSTPAADSVTDAAPEWDGSDWSTLDQQPWWASVPESARGHFNQAHTERTEAKERADYLDRLFGADDDAIRRDLESVTKERDDLKKSLGDIEERTAEDKEEQEYTRLSTKYADIWADSHPDPSKDGELLSKGAYVRFVELLSKGFSEDDAATMARAVMITKPAAVEAAPVETGGPPKTRDVRPPPSIAQASKGGNNPSATVNAKEANESIDQRRRRLIKQYEAEEKGA